MQLHLHYIAYHLSRILILARRLDAAIHHDCYAHTYVPFSSGNLKLIESAAARGRAIASHCHTSLHYGEEAEEEFTTQQIVELLLKDAR